MAWPPEALKQVAEVAKEKGQVQISVRQLLRWYGYERRGSWIVGVIRKNLDKLGVRTVPDFESVWIDAVIYVMPAESAQPDTSPSSIPDAGQGAEDPTAEASPVTPAHRISRLKASVTDVVWVKPDDPLTKATTLMFTHDFSQLPVMQNERSVIGMISWRSIGQKTTLGKNCSVVRDCMGAHHVASINGSIFDVIQQIMEHDCVLIRGSENRITGIVTAADIAEQFQTLSEPFLVLGDIETRIRRLIGERFTGDELQDAKDPSDTHREVSSIADLGFGEYKRLLEKPERWSKLGLPLDRQVFICQLDAVRQIRNDVMHFDPDGIADEQMETLRKFNRSLERALEVLDESPK